MYIVRYLYSHIDFCDNSSYSYFWIQSNLSIVFILYNLQIFKEFFLYGHLCLMITSKRSSMSRIEVIYLEKIIRYMKIKRSLKHE